MPVPGALLGSLLELDGAQRRCLALLAGVAYPHWGRRDFVVMHADRGRPPPAPPPSDRGDAGGTIVPARPRVLLAEDDPELRRMIARRLRTVGYDVVEARDGAELDALLARHAPGDAVDLLVSDVRMPGRSGLAIASELQRAGRALPIILMTGFGDREVHEQARHLGVLAVLDKPFDLDELCAAVSAAVR